METVITEHAPNHSKKIFRGKSYNAIRAKGADPWRWGRWPGVHAPRTLANFRKFCQNDLFRNTFSLSPLLPSSPYPAHGRYNNFHFGILPLLRGSRYGSEKLLRFKSPWVTCLHSCPVYRRCIHGRLLRNKHYSSQGQQLSDVHDEQTYSCIAHHSCCCHVEDVN